MNFTKVKQSLKKHESVEAVPYQDSLGNWTVGVGHLMSRPLSAAAIEQILEDDVHVAIQDLDRDFTDWRQHPEPVQDVLVELMFAMGAPVFSEFKRMRAALDAVDYGSAAAELLDSTWAREVGARAQTLAAIISEQMGS